MPELHLDLSQPQQQRLRVTLHHTPRQRQLAFALPRWTPGSYLLREYVGHLEGLQLHQGDKRLSPRRVTPFRWELELESLEPVRLEYALQATELTVRTCHLTAEHGFFALAAVALQIDGERWSSHRLSLALPDGWNAFVPLPAAADGGWLARDFDQLIDSPLECGPHPCHSFAVAGVPHQWVGWGGDLPSSDATWLQAVEQVCLACCRLMGVERPAADAYLFVLHLSELGYGGLEHDASTVLHFGRRTLAGPDGRRKLLQLVAHEYLHQWNVRRLRPAELAPIDYDRAVVVPTLWFAEGVTSYVDQLLPHAAGLCDADAVLKDLGADLSRYRLSPGRFVQSLSDSSQEAWVKLYRPHPYAANQQISYYLKGAVLALVLDLHLRRQGSWLGAVLQQLWLSHGRHRRGYSSQDLLEAFGRCAPDLAVLLPQWLESTDDPPLEAYLADVGLALVPVASSSPSFGWQLEQRPTGGLWINRIERDGPAQRAGLQVGDELIAVDGERLRSGADLELLMSKVKPVQVLFSRDALVRTLCLEPAPPVIERWLLQSDPELTPMQLQRRSAWLALQP